MAWGTVWYTMCIENKDSSMISTPRFVRVQVKYAIIPIVDDGWVIGWSETNNWVGVGSGKLVKIDSTLRFMLNDEIYWMQWYDIDFPQDCRQNGDKAWKTGKGEYCSRFTGNQWLGLEWSNRNIIPEP